MQRRSINQPDATDTTAAGRSSKCSVSVNSASVAKQATPKGAIEALDLVTRQRDPHDERSLAIDLTRKGRELRKQALEVPLTIVEKLGMTLDELASLHSALTRVIGAASGALQFDGS